MVFQVAGLILASSDVRPSSPAGVTGFLASMTANLILQVILGKSQADVFAIFRLLFIIVTEQLLKPFP